MSRRVRWVRSLALASVCAASSAAAAEPRMRKGPYLQDLAPTSITVMWQLDAPAPAKLTVIGPGGEGTDSRDRAIPRERSVDVAAANIAEARIDRLVPSSRYRYRVEVGGKAWAGEFATAPPIGKAVPYSFIVAGDSRYGLEPHRRIVERIVQEVPDFVLGTGDMVDDGSRQDQWQQFFDIEQRLLRDYVYFPAVGNHDRQGRGRTADTYRAYFSVPENGGDTERYYAFTYADTRFLVLDSNIYSFALVDQTSWLERELIAARQDAAIHHIFVVMHHPPFSISLHGGARDLRERWTPLFAKYQVSAVFSGHDHVYSRAEHDGVRYFVSGGGGAPLYPLRPHSHPIDVAAVKKFERVYHYLRVNVSGQRVEVTGVRTDGTQIETTTWKEGPPPPPAAPKPPKSPGAKPGVPAVGAPAVAVAAPVAGLGAGGSGPGGEGEGGVPLLWFGIGGVGLLLGAAVVVVRTLRR
ncbi:MAG: metallophosphoesterase family protein [Deltaproteobacteria bacterium]|nr:metallophosphoesterase family protein [Deltaproteobacteria bacterium]